MFTRRSLLTGALLSLTLLGQETSFASSKPSGARFTSGAGLLSDIYCASGNVNYTAPDPSEGSWTSGYWFYTTDNPGFGGVKTLGLQVSVIGVQFSVTRVGTGSNTILSGLLVASAMTMGENTSAVAMTTFMGAGVGAASFNGSESPDDTLQVIRTIEFDESGECNLSVQVGLSLDAPVLSSP